MNRIVGIDPGLDGGLALLHSHEPRPLLLTMPTLGEGRRELHLAAVAEQLRVWRPHLVVIEAQQAMPKQGVSSTFRIGLNFGQLLGLLAGLSIPYQTVRPQQWQGVMLKGAPRNAGTKAAGSLVAARLWPAAIWEATPRCKTPHDGLVDAALIAEYGRRHLVGAGQQEDFLR